MRDWFGVRPLPWLPLVTAVAWPRDEPEPEQWTISVEDSRPIPRGGPGIYGFPIAEIHFDNLTVTEMNP